MTSLRTSKIQASKIMAMSQKAKLLRSQGRKIIDLTLGEPDYDTPDFIIKSASNAMIGGFTKYTAFDGMPSLKEAVINKLQHDNKLIYKPEEIVVTNGVKQAMFNSCMAILNPGDKVIVPSPYWVSYSAMIALSSAESVLIKTSLEGKFKITPKQLDEAIDEKTKLLILNSPGNPSGSVYTLDELKALGSVLIKYPHVKILSDDIYEYLTWAECGFNNILNACPDLGDRTVICNGVSKAYAMTGWRIGYVAGPEYVVSKIRKIQAHSTGCANSIAQAASITALNSGKGKILSMLDSFRKRQKIMFNMLQKIPGVACIPSDGAFYLFPEVSSVMEKLGFSTDLELCEHILNVAHVATVPGSAFECPYHIRLSYSVNEEELIEGVDRIKKLFSDAYELGYARNIAGSPG